MAPGMIRRYRPAAMANVVFVAPYALDATTRFVTAVPGTGFLQLKRLPERPDQLQKACPPTTAVGGTGDEGADPGPRSMAIGVSGR
jgi:hypothetical protein